MAKTWSGEDKSDTTALSEGDKYNRIWLAIHDDPWVRFHVSYYYQNGHYSYVQIHVYTCVYKSTFLNPNSKYRWNHTTMALSTYTWIRLQCGILQYTCIDMLCPHIMLYCKEICLKNYFVAKVSILFLICNNRFRRVQKPTLTWQCSMASLITIIMRYVLGKIMDKR